jgi:ATP-dependent DNA helicase DinG
MQCPSGHMMPFNEDAPEGFDCIYCELRQMPSAADLLQEKKLKFVREKRPGQISLAEAVTRDLYTGESGVYEAGTGIGKSFAYLLPAIISGKRVIVSTAKIALQTQLMEKDLPHIQTELKRLNHPKQNFKFFAAYGRANYACPVLYKKERGDDKHAMKIFNLFEKGTEYQRFDEWDSHKGFLDRSLNAVACTGPNCVFYRTCGFQRAKREVAQADVVVTNNWMLGYHLRLQRENSSTMLLGEYDHIIVDEAHKVEDGIRAAFTNETKIDTLSKLQKQLSKLEAATMENLDIPELSKLPPFWEHAFNALAHCKRNQDTTLPAGVKQQLGRVSHQLDLVRDAALHSTYLQKIFPYAGTAGTVQQYLDDKYSPSKNAALPPAVPPNPYINANPQPPLTLSDALQPRLLDLDKFFQILKEAEDTFANIFEESPYRTWIYEDSTDARPIPSLKSVPITIGHYMPKKHISYLSATLALGTSFDTFVGRVGLNNHPYNAQLFPSPFDIQKQAFLYIPNPGNRPGRIPTPVNTQGPARDTYLEAVASQTHDLLMASEGDAFVLFTAKTELYFVHDYLKAKNYPFALFAQGELKPSEALQRFRATPKSTILGVKSFWEGVDVQGDKLFLVIVAKLPFPNTSDPIYQARCALVNKANPGCSERVVRVPDMLFDLRQGVGRLIRSKTDRGIIAILDTRAHLQYKGAVRAALNLREHTDLEKMCRAIRTRHNKRSAAE